jgi:hypothetical protein
MAHRPLCPETLRWAASRLHEVALDHDLWDAHQGPGRFARELNGTYADQWNRLEGERQDAKRQCWYYGTWKGAGHYFHEPGGRQPHLKSPEKLQPFGYPYDLQPDCEQREGPAALHHKDGWTCLTWWDRHEDRRGGCIGAVIFEGEHSFNSMLKILEEKFPRVFNRRRLTPWGRLDRSENGRASLMMRMLQSASQRRIS